MKRFMATIVSHSTGFTRTDHFNALSKAKSRLHEYINDASYAVRIWDNAKEDYVLWQ